MFVSPAGSVAQCSASDSRSPILIRILFSFSFLFLGFQFFLPHMKKAHLERISPWAYLRRHETKTLNTLPEPSLSVSLSSPNLGSPRIRTNETARPRSRRTFPASSPLSPPRLSHGHRHAEDQGHRG
jgi:hypothetical protein